jgi:formylglycine-generating enzyme required for sulfatase activity
MDFVTIGNAGNGTDPATGNLYGAVSSNYRIGKYEVTAAQWQTINTAAGIGDSGAWSGNQPTGYVSWYDAAQFCNYLTSGNKYSGAYKFDISGNFQVIDRVSSISTYGTTYVIPTEDEWYKAAYHKNDGVTGNYWLYPTQSNDVPSNDLIDPDPGNNANFYQDGYTIGSPDYLTAVGEFENSDSAYGTFDQGGNVWEWNETLIGGSRRGIRGGSFGSFDDSLRSSYRSIGRYPNFELDDVGFRVASVPEPATICLFGLGVLSLIRKIEAQRK